MTRLYNFSAGPAALPVEVLEQVQRDLVDWQGAGLSVMEMSHRGKEFMGIAAQAEADLRELMGIPDNYKVLFLQGGGQPAVRHGATEPLAGAAEGRLRQYRAVV